VRIFQKECLSLAAAGFDVHLIIAATENEGEIAANKRVKIHALPPATGRFERMFFQAWRCYRIAKSLQADIYHFHDPELIPYGILFALSGKKVIYDAHEDVPKDILTKEWIPLWMRKAISRTVSAIEYIGARYFFSIVAATPFIAQRFKKITPYATDINNFPLLDDLASAASWAQKQPVVCYVGGIGKIRGIVEVTQAMGLVQSAARLQLAGQFSERDLQQRVQALPGWQRVDALGFVDRSGVRGVLARSMAGLVTFLPAPNHIDAQPNKMFEYMSAGTPVIASDFPLWREIIAGNDCGLLVNPLNPAQIAEAIDHLVTHPDDAERMGRNGRKAVLERYNWPNEEKKLLDFYERVLSGPKAIRVS
jgi:glycosyltransferase involved in cell wall biosynthesis